MIVKFKLNIKKFDEGLWTYHIIIPQKIVDKFSADGNKRVICKIDNNEEFHAGFMPDGKSNWFVKLNKERMQTYGLQVGQSVQVQLSKDESKYGMEMPEEFEELLHQDPEGEAFFQALTPGKKRSLIYVVSKVKSQDIRINKSMVILQHLKMNNGKLNFKDLNEALKNKNQDLDSFFR